MPKKTANFFKKVLRKTKCARLQNAIGRKGNINSIIMMCVFTYKIRISGGGGRAFFEKRFVGLCRYKNNTAAPP
nr:hypothetical protein [uncultured Anaerostipes sp.]